MHTAPGYKKAGAQENPATAGRFCGGVQGPLAIRSPRAPAVTPAGSEGPAGEPKPYLLAYSRAGRSYSLSARFRNVQPDFDASILFAALAGFVIANG